MKSGPPADWVEFVRRNARNAPVRMTNRVSAPRPAAEESPAPQPAVAAVREVRTEEVAPTVAPQPPRRESTEGAPFVPGSPASPRGWPFMGSPEVVPRTGQQAEPLRASSTETPGVAAPRGGLAPAFQELRVERPMKRPVPRFEAADAPPAASPRSKVPKQEVRPRPQVHPPTARAEANGPSEPERTWADGSMVARILAPVASHSRHSEARFDAAPAPREWPPAVYPWNEEPAAERKAASEQEPSEELSTLIERSWPDLAEKEEQPPAQPPSEGPERPEIRWSGPWPELPEASPAESEEAGALLRQWERLSRLDREQRGE